MQFEHSESIGKISEALAKAQGQFPTVEKDSTAKVRSEKANYEFDYATLDRFLEAVRKPLSDNGLAVMQFPAVTGKDASVKTVISHLSGEWVSGTLVMPVSRWDAQGIGSIITYLRRYSLCAILGLAPRDEDDDGNAGVGNPAQVEPRQRPVNGKPNGKPQQPPQKKPEPEQRKADEPPATPPKKSRFDNAMAAIAEAHTVARIDEILTKIRNPSMGLSETETKVAEGACDAKRSEIESRNHEEAGAI